MGACVVADVAVTVIGGGVVGLAVAAELAEAGTAVLLLERNPKYGQETSSRNSEVIHAGIYYPAGSLKARLCVEGRELLYALCRKHEIPHRKITKIITATNTTETPALEGIRDHGSANGAPLELLTGDQIHALEPAIVSVGGLFSPTTGIISAHALMDYFAHAAKDRGAIIQTRCTVTGIARQTSDYEIEIAEESQRSTVTSEMVVNAAGLESDTIAALAGIDVDATGYRLTYSKGCYFALPSSLSKLVSRLVYPVPTTHSLGVHAVLDLGGRLKFGPDAEYLADRTLDYRVAEEKRSRFAASVRRILPSVRDEDLSPDMCGIRPKLQREADSFRDFVIREESDQGLPGFVNLIGIESPGLTSSPAIARMVKKLLLG
jgi:L-2-hydroxyglutarate oxidase LhgO